MRTLLLGGVVHTALDPGATALLVEDGVIGWLGSEGAALAQRDGVDRVIDLAGALVTPAFVDAHVHTTMTGLHATGVDLTGCGSAGDVVAAVRARAAGLPAGHVLLGHGWDETTWTDPAVPTRAQLDQAAPGTPVLLSRVDVHTALANTALLDLHPGIDALPGFRADGRLTAAAHHAARAAVHSRIPAGQRGAARDAALAAFAAAGIAAVHEMAGPDLMGADDLTALLAAGTGPHVTGYWGELGGARRARELGAAGAGGDLCVDGTLGSHTAALLAPYADRPHRGDLHLDRRDVRDHVLDCVAEGVQAGFHVIGDAALAEALAGFRAAADRVGVERIRAGRHRLEHVELPDAAAIQTLVDLGITVSGQPLFDERWGGADRMYARRLGPDRAAGMNPWRALQRAGVPLAFGSDTPVTPADPWQAVTAAVHHRTPASAISARAGFNAHTRGGWRAVGVDDAGVIAPGAAATLAVWAAGDLAVQIPDQRVAGWSTDPRSGTPVLPTLAPGQPPPRCLVTMRAGAVIHDAGELDITGEPA